MQQRVLIAGIGNIFLGDDGFGVEVIKRLAAEALPDWVRIADFGIRGMHRESCTCLSLIWRRLRPQHTARPMPMACILRLCSDSSAPSAGPRDGC